MNNLGITLVGVAVQVTLVALVAAVLYGVMARRGPDAGSLTARLGLVGIVALTFAAFVPLPRWWSWSASGERAVPVDVATSGATAVPLPDVEKKAAAAETPHESGNGSGWSLAGLRGLLSRLSRDKEAAPEKSGGGPWIVAALFLVGLTLCLLRLTCALWAVRGFLQRGFRIDDPALNDLAATLGAEMGSPGRVELRECPDLAGAATVGWRHPVVLLPSDWRGWSEQERRTVLAHELAHVHRRDYAAGGRGSFRPGPALLPPAGPLVGGTIAAATGAGGRRAGRTLRGRPPVVLDGPGGIGVAARRPDHRLAGPDVLFFKRNLDEEVANVASQGRYFGQIADEDGANAEHRPSGRNRSRGLGAARSSARS